MAIFNSYVKLPDDSSIAEGFGGPLVDRKFGIRSADPPGSSSIFAGEPAKKNPMKTLAISS